MKPKTRKLVDIAFAHLGRFAFFTRDNPFLSSTAAISMSSDQRQLIGDLLERKRPTAEWLESPQARVLRERIRIGCLPRDVQLVSPEGEARVGVESVHTFLHAPLFWWLVSILWTITVGRRLDRALGEHITGYRLATDFVEHPGRHSTMFRPGGASYRTWKAFPAEYARKYPGETFAATTLDVRNFYYSVSASPGQIVETFTSALGCDIAFPAHARVLNDLLDALHTEFASRYVAAEPRGPIQSNPVPLPVGPPSSQILANLIMSLVARDVVQETHVVAAATYADDIVLLTSTLPQVQEDTSSYLRRLDLLEPDGLTLQAPSVAEVASLDVGLDKSSTVFVRGVAGDREDEPEAEEDEPLDPYIAGDPSPEWGGGLRTVLRAPYRRERLPHALKKDIRRLLGEIRVGLDPDQAQDRVRTLIDDLDNASFLAVRPYWSDLLVAAIAALGAESAPALTDQFDKLVRSLDAPPGAAQATVDALNFGLRAAWIHALAQGLSAALGSSERTAFGSEFPRLISAGPIGDLDSATVVRYANRLRARRLVDPDFVATPLAEFTDWSGALIGETASADFRAWSATATPRDRRGWLRKNLPRSVRFITLHEACLALHIWAGSREEKWLDDAFDLMSSQPLVADDSLDGLRALSRDALQPREAFTPEQAEDLEHLVFRIAMPSMHVSELQLQALLDDDRAIQGTVARAARSATMHVVLTAEKRGADVLVLPEWAVPAELIPWVMGRAANKQMLVVAGQAPAVSDGEYSNALWVGIPLRDDRGRKACLIPPPREKNYLSPHERASLDSAKVEWDPGAGDVPTYNWRGLSFASLICFEFADIRTRQSLQHKADVLTVSSLNRDWRYFGAVQEATTRDNYCLTICVNTSSYPGTQIMRPTVSAKALAASVHGSEDATVVTRVIDLAPIVAARAEGKHPRDLEFADAPQDDTTLQDYKPLPPG